MNKAWFGEPLGFAYVAKEKSLDVKAHTYRLCLITGIQPANANVILEDADSGTPARHLWMPTLDLSAPVVRPDDPGPWRGWSLSQAFGDPDHVDPAALHPLDACQAAKDAVDNAALDRLHGVATDPLSSHRLLSRLKTAAALALLDGRVAIGDEDWQLAGVVHDVSDNAREQMIGTLRAKARDAGTARASEEGRREVIKSGVVADHDLQRACQSILRKLGRQGDWVSGKVAKDAVGKLRGHFEEAVDRLAETGQIEVEPVAGTGQAGIRLRLSGATK